MSAPNKQRDLTTKIHPMKDTWENELSKLQPKEKARLDEVIAKIRARSDAPAMKLKMTDGALDIAFQHDEPDLARFLLMADLSTCDPHFLLGIGRQVAVIGAQGKKIDETNSNFLLSVVRGVQPRDELESMLAMQMGAIHQATMMMARRFNHVETIPQQDAAERALNKLARTYAMQMEALKRYRTGGQQKVLVGHVTVNAGGQAIVGNVARSKKE